MTAFASSPVSIAFLALSALALVLRRSIRTTERCGERRAPRCEAAIHRARPRSPAMSQSQAQPSRPCPGRPATAGSGSDGGPPASPREPLSQRPHLAGIEPPRRRRRRRSRHRPRSACRPCRSWWSGCPRAGRSPRSWQRSPVQQPVELFGVLRQHEPAIGRKAPPGRQTPRPPRRRLRWPRDCPALCAIRSAPERIFLPARPAPGIAGSSRSARRASCRRRRAQPSGG